MKHRSMNPLLPPKWHIPDGEWHIKAYLPESARQIPIEDKG